MRKPNDLTNKVFGRLTAIKIVENKKKGAYWLCQCKCGNTTVVRNDKLLDGTTSSCGCYKKEYITTKNKTHALGLSRTPIYKRYRTMLQRCYYQKNTRIKKYYYQDRGITVCDEWLGNNGFINFYNWAMQNGFSPNLTIDRIDNNKGYSPDNCRWVDYKTQRANQRPAQRDGHWLKLHLLDLQDKKER